MNVNRIKKNLMRHVVKQVGNKAYRQINKLYKHCSNNKSYNEFLYNILKNIYFKVGPDLFYYYSDYFSLCDTKKTERVIDRISSNDNLSFQFINSGLVSSKINNIYQEYFIHNDVFKLSKEHLKYLKPDMNVSIVNFIGCLFLKHPSVKIPDGFDDMDYKTFIIKFFELIGESTENLDILFFICENFSIGDFFESFNIIKDIKFTKKEKDYLYYVIKNLNIYHKYCACFVTGFLDKHIIYMAFLEIFFTHYENREYRSVFVEKNISFSCMIAFFFNNKILSKIHKNRVVKLLPYCLKFFKTLPKSYPYIANNNEIDEPFIFNSLRIIFKYMMDDKLSINKKILSFNFEKNKAVLSILKTIFIVLCGRYSISHSTFDNMLTYIKDNIENMDKLEELEFLCMIFNSLSSFGISSSVEILLKLFLEGNYDIYNNDIMKLDKFYFEYEHNIKIDEQFIIEFFKSPNNVKKLVENC